MISESELSDSQSKIQKPEKKHLSLYDKSSSYTQLAKTCGKNINIIHLYNGKTDIEHTTRE